MFVISSSYKLFKNAESEHCLFDRFFKQYKYIKCVEIFNRKMARLEIKNNKNYLQKGEITFLMWLLNEGHLISKFSLLPFGIISTKSTFKLSPSKFCQNRWRPTPSTCLTTKNKTHRFFWSKTKLSNYTPILYTASHFFIFFKCCNMVHIFTLSYIKIIVVNFNYYKLFLILCVSTTTN